MEKHMAVGILVNKKLVSVLCFDKIIIDDDLVRFYNNNITTSTINSDLFKHNMRISKHFEDGNTYSLNIKDW